MNHTYLVVWNAERASHVAVSETARRRGKSGGLRALSAVLLSSLAVTVHALPVGSQISSGQGGVATSGTAMTVTQKSQNLAINWQSFGIRANESVRFVQPNNSAIALNRVLGTSQSQILGKLNANGQVFILNPNGVLFGACAQVNVGSLLASTLSISDADFMAGKRTFSGKGGSVTNLGSITAADGGYVALLGGQVSNQGVIQAKLGTVALGAGKVITLEFAGNQLLKLQVDQGVVNALAQNKQLIRANGGNVILSAQAVGTLLNTVVNNTGIIEARTVANHNGTIKLLGGTNGGTVQVSGTLDASAPNGGDGGFIETAGAQVKVGDSVRITTKARSGETRTWLIEPASFTIASGGGNISGKTLQNQLSQTNVSIVTSKGDITSADRVTWSGANSLTLSAYRNVKVANQIHNNGTGDVTLRADNTGSCVAGATSCGTVSFTSKGRISVHGGSVNIYYNPLGSNHAADANGNGPSYASPTDYSGKVRLKGGRTLKAWMLVNDVNQLQAMNTNLNGRYALGKDVNASATAGWNQGAGFVPVGSAATPFWGSLDGGNHVIDGLTIFSPEKDEVGLFGENRGSITNVGLTGANLKGGGFIGGLAGINAGTISNSYVIGDVNDGYDYGIYDGDVVSGGLVGINTGRIENSYTGGSVFATWASPGVAGGLVGINTGVISESHSASNVHGDTNSLGGLVGVNKGGTIVKSYATGTVSGAIASGGLVGANDELGIISDSYATGQVTGNYYGISIGGLVGENRGRIRNSYATGDVSSSQDGSTAGGLVGLNLGLITNAHATGDVASYSSAGGLVGINFGVVKDVYATGRVSAYTADFGYEGGAGGLMGYNAGMVENAYATGLVIGSRKHNGGLVGGNAGTLNKVYATGAVVSDISGGWEGSQNNGGLVGYNTGTIDNAYATGNVTTLEAAYNNAGLVAVNTGSIAHSYSTGAVSGGFYNGGLVATNSGIVTDSYWNLTTSGQSTSAGGTGLTTLQMKQKASFTGFNFLNTWDIKEGVSYPFLRAF